MTLMTVPCIDIAPYLAGRAEEKRRVAQQVDRACEDIGFLVITGHGVDPLLCDRLFAVGKTFFDLPLAEKIATFAAQGIFAAVIFEPSEWP